jgi:uroporphyrinogen-III decarboxylase
MTSRERVKRVFNFKKPDRLPVFDLVCSDSEDYKSLDFDIEIINNAKIDINKTNNKFRMLEVNDPFQALSNIHGLENVLRGIAEEPSNISRGLKRIFHDIMEKTDSLIKKYEDIDGIWLWADIAYKRDLLFSENYYDKQILPFHKEICERFNSQHLPVVLHSDGNLNGIMPQIIEAGFRGLHPVEESSGMKLDELKQIYGDKIVFIGGFKVDILNTRYDIYEDILNRLDKINAFEVGYIFGFESPITEHIDIEKYAKIVKIIREYGRASYTYNIG